MTPKIKTSLFAFTIWALLALLFLLPVSILLNGSFPIFTDLWIAVPLVVAWRVKDTSRVGFRSVPWRLFLQTSGINLGILLLIMLVFEPWSHTYQRLLELVFSSSTPDTTFAWMVRFPKVPALGAMTLYSGLVTLFGEELFFQGWLLQKRVGTRWAVALQALLFVIPNLLVAFALPFFAGILVRLYLYLARHRVGWRQGSLPDRQHLAGLDLGNIMQSCFGGIYFLLKRPCKVE